jgi:hypothetical protein
MKDPACRSRRDKTPNAFSSSDSGATPFTEGTDCCCASSEDGDSDRPSNPIGLTVRLRKSNKTRRGSGCKWTYLLLLTSLVLLGVTVYIQLNESLISHQQQVPLSSTDHDDFINKKLAKKFHKKISKWDKIDEHEKVPEPEASDDEPEKKKKLVRRKKKVNIEPSADEQGNELESGGRSDTSSRQVENSLVDDEVPEQPR